MSSKETERYSDGGGIFQGFNVLWAVISSPTHGYAGVGIVGGGNGSEWGWQRKDDEDSVKPLFVRGDPQGRHRPAPQHPFIQRV